MALTPAEQKELDKVNEAEYQKTLKGDKKLADSEAAPVGAVEVKIEPAKSTTKNETPKEHPTEEETKKETEKNEKSKEVPVVSSVAQLRDAAAAEGKTVTTEQVAEARAVEDKTNEELSKVTRLPAAEQVKK